MAKKLISRTPYWYHFAMVIRSRQVTLRVPPGGRLRQHCHNSVICLNLNIESQFYLNGLCKWWPDCLSVISVTRESRGAVLFDFKPKF